MQQASPTPDRDPAQARRRYWSRRLGRLRLNAEPLGVQLERYRRVNLALTAVSGGVALLFLSLFTAFRYPLVGLTIVALVLLPIVAIAWLDWIKLKQRVRRFEAECAPTAPAAGNAEGPTRTA